MKQGTICIQGCGRPKEGEPRQVPIVQSTTFRYDTSDAMGRLFNLEASGYFYSRLCNPTNDTVARKITALEGGTAGLLTSSGQAAIFYALFNLANAGDHIVASSTIYGGAYNLIATTMKKMGVDVTFIEPDWSDDQINAAFRPNTKVFYGETLANPALVVLDLERFAKIAHSHGVPVLVDGAQATAHMAVDVQALDADFYAFSAHKMYGPSGVGVLYGKEALLADMPPYQGGGEMIGTVSFEGTTFAELPFKFEAGTPDFVDIAAFSRTLDYLQKLGIENIAAHEQTLLEAATAGLQQIPGLTIYGTAAHKHSVLSFLVDGASSYDIGILLDKLGVAVRTGHHCAQPLMRRLGIEGTVRASFAVYNTMHEVEQFVAATARVAKMFARK